MAKFEKAIPKVLKWEAGLVDHPDDPGGLTNRGITFAVFKRNAREVLGIKPSEVNLKHLTEDQAKKIYRAKFWDPIRASEITSQAVADIVFDMHVNATRTAIPMLQQLLNKGFGNNLPVDGKMGPATLEAVNSAGPGRLHDAYKRARIIYYNYRANNLIGGREWHFFFKSRLRISPRPDQKVFLKGWLNRANDFVDLLKKKAWSGLLLGWGWWLGSAT